MYIVLTKTPYSKKLRYVVKDFPDTKDEIIASVSDVLNIFWYTNDNGDQSIVRKLELPQKTLHIIKSITDKSFNERIKGSDYHKNQTRYETGNKQP